MSVIATVTQCSSRMAGSLILEARKRILLCFIYIATSLYLIFGPKFTFTFGPTFTWHSKFAIEKRELFLGIETIETITTSTTKYLDVGRLLKLYISDYILTM